MGSSRPDIEAALQQASIPDRLGPGRKPDRRPAPLQLVHVAKEWRVGYECCELLEEQRNLSLAPQHIRREVLDRTVPIQQPGGGGPTYAGNPGIPVLRIADQREQVGDQ